MAEKRYIFWDGIPNVKSDGNIETTLEKKKLQRANAKASKAIKRSEPKGKGNNRIVIADPTVKIVSVDEWFVPVRDLLAIQLEFNALHFVKSMMLRIYACDGDNAKSWFKISSKENQSGADHFNHLIYQQIFYTNEIAQLSQNNTSENEDKAKKDVRVKKSNKDPVPCLTHCKVVVWIATHEDEFNSIDGKTKMEEFRLGTDYTRVRNGDQLNSGFGVDETMAACEFIENIFDNKTSLKIEDVEPTDSSWINNKEVKGTGKAFPKFKSQLREAFYHICANSKIAMALIRSVANEQESKSVTIFPADTVYYSIGGCAIGSYTPAGGAAVSIKDDYDAHTQIEEIKKEIKAGNIRQPDDPQWLPGGQWDANYEYEEGPLDFAAKRYLFSQIGASKQGTGCKSRFYFNENSINLLLSDTYRVVHHETVGSHKSTVNGKEFIINIAASVKDSKDEEPVIETPLFVALAHEMIHARRIQLGLNAEWDGINEPDNYDGILRHPSSMVEKLKAQVGLNGLTKDGVQNLMSRYAPYNREEWDTIEGGGAPVTLDHKTFDAFVAKGVIDKSDITGNPNEVRVTENLIRKELKLNLRYRYVDNPTKYVAPIKAAPDSDLEKKINTPRKLIQKPQTPDIGANIAEKIRKEIDNLIEKDAQLPHRDLVTLKPESNYFVRRSARFSLAKRFKAVAKLPVDPAEWDKQDKSFVEGVFDQIIKNESNTVAFTTRAASDINEVRTAKPPGRVEDSAKAIWIENKLREMNSIDPADIQIVINNSNGKLIAGSQIRLTKQGADADDKAAIYDALLADEQGLLNSLSVSGRQKAAIKNKPLAVIENNQKAAWVDSLLNLGPAMADTDRTNLTGNSDSKLVWNTGTNKFTPKLGQWNEGKKVALYDAFVNNDSEVKATFAKHPQLSKPTAVVSKADKAEYIDKILKETFDTVDLKPIADRSGGGITESINLKLSAQNPDAAAKAGVYDELLKNKNPILQSVSVAGKTKLDTIYSSIPFPTFTHREKADHVLRFLQRLFWFSDDDLSQVLKIYTKIEEARTADAGVDCFAGYNMDPKVVPVDNDLGREANPASRAAAYLHEHWANEPIENVRHALVHEPMHMFSFGGTGFNDWQLNAGVNGAAFEAAMKKIPGGNEKARLSDLKSVLDEGATEMLTRIVCYRINHSDKNRIFEITRLQGFPYYEWPVHLVCQIIRDLKQLKGKEKGFKIFAGAFYDGKWGELNDSLFQLQKQSANFNNRYSPEFWKYASELAISNLEFEKSESVSSEAVKKMRTVYDVHMLLGAEIKTALDDGSYRDPVCYKYYPGPTYILDPLIPNKMKECCEINVNNAVTQADQQGKPIEKISVCLHCKQRINVPVETIFKS